MSRSGRALVEQPAAAPGLAHVRYEIIIPTRGRASLKALLGDLARLEGTAPERIILVDDRVDQAGSLFFAPLPFELEPLLRILPGRALGPAAARNVGWRAGSAPWVVFLDDDVRLTRQWYGDLARDLASLPRDVGGSQGRIHVPLPRHRPPTDWERHVATLEHAQWAVADMAYRREALLRVGGFDERFERAYRDDADIGLRVVDSGWQIVRGERRVEHPVRDADLWASLRRERGNADDVLMSAIHGPRWRERAGAPPGARDRHIATVALAVGALAGAAAGAAPFALGCAAAWLCSTASFAWQRIARGPRTVDEALTLTATSVVLPFAATWHWLGGHARTTFSSTEPHRPPQEELPARPIRAVLVDRDGTLVDDVPDNGDPALVRPRPTAREALDRLRAAGLPIVVISNQSGVGRGLISDDEVDAVNARIEALLGPFDGWLICPHAPDEGCTCKKPRPGMIWEAASDLDVEPADCVVIGDGSDDVEAAFAAGARSILVPTSETRAEDIWQAPEVAADLAAAVERVVERSQATHAGGAP